MKVSRYKHILRPLKIKGMTLPNRLFFPPLSLHWANTDGTVSDKLLKFYTDLAASGCGLIITGAAVVSKNSGAAALEDDIFHDRRMSITNDAYIPGLKRLFTEISRRGSVPAIQLYHTGRQAISSSGVRLAPSAVPSSLAQKFSLNYRIKEMDLYDIRKVQDDFVAAAVRSAEAGAKMIQLHCGHGFLLNQFLSNYSNRRIDEYGGSIENRTRFIVEIIRRIKKLIGDAALIDVRISANEFVENGLIPQEYQIIGPLLEAAGADIINVSFGVLETLTEFLSQKQETGIKNVESARLIKGFVKVPVGYAAFINSLDTAEYYLSEGYMDLVGMGRAQLADPYLMKKSIEDKENQIIKCIWDSKCLQDLINPALDMVYCSVNPDYKRPRELPADCIP
jgi:2,4-dienoyl-CoA reductase-like NADH-dependent reductase (Old Yellow Enzyme family)